MDEIISINRRVARKAHQCNACEWLFADGIGRYGQYRNFGGSFAEYREISKAVGSLGMIRPGEAYDEVVGVYEGQIVRVRQKPAIHDICTKYDFYEY